MRNENKGCRKIQEQGYNCGKLFVNKQRVNIIAYCEYCKYQMEYEKGKAKADKEWLNKLLPEQIDVSVKQEQKRILEMLDKYEGVILSDFQKSWLKAKIKEDGKK